jgi:hypothetical protein
MALELSSELKSGLERKRIAAVSVLVGLTATAILMLTVRDYGLTWDEPVYIQSADGVSGWFSKLFVGGIPGIRESFRDDRILQSWSFACPANRNLPVPALISSAGRIIGAFLSPPGSYRVGHCLLMALTTAMLFYSLALQQGLAPASVAAGSLLFMPHIFAHAHLNATDVPVSCMWVWTLLAWQNSGSSWYWRVLTAIACGLGLATKATFLLVIPLLVAWMILFRRWRYWKAIVTIALVAPLVMMLFCPMWWASPLSRPLEYFGTVLQADSIWKSEVYYLGETYIVGQRNVPWHNGWVLLAVQTPAWTLLLAFVGAASGIRARAASVTLWTLAALLLPALRMLPSTPAHDGVRLLLPSIFCLGPLASFGFSALTSRNVDRGTRVVVVRWLIVLLIVSLSVAATISMHPYELSYYSEAIGGLYGAASLGFEISYWFDAYTPVTIRDVQRHLPDSARVWTFPKYEGYPLLRQWNLWRSDLIDTDVGEAEFLILYARKSRFYAIPGIEDYYRQGKPVWSVRCRGVQIIGLYKLPKKR